MTEWSAIAFTEARQVAELAELETLPDTEVGVRAHHHALRELGRDDEALTFVAHALPRAEAIGWAGRILEEEARTVTLDRADRLALDYALRWLGEPDDARRRSAYDTAHGAGERAPERLLCLAVYFSGGSISLPDLPPVLPRPEIAGRFAAAAVRTAAYRSANPAAVIQRALDLAESVGERGASALGDA